MERAPVHIQLSGNTPSRDIGSALARDIKMKLGLECGWMDQPLHYSDPEHTGDLLSKLERLPHPMRERIETLVDLLAQLYEKDRLA